MIIGFATKGWEDYIYWQKNDKKILMDIFQDELQQNID